MASLQFDAEKDADLLEELPLWSDVVNLYGSEPVIYGLEEGNCKRFQEQSEKGDHFITKIAAVEAEARKVFFRIRTDRLIMESFFRTG